MPATATASVATTPRRLIEKIRAKGRRQLPGSALVASPYSSLVVLILVSFDDYDDCDNDDEDR